MEILSGIIQKKISDSDWKLDDGNGGSQQDIPIIFDPAFISAPKKEDLFAAFSGIDISTGYDVKLNIAIKQIEKNLAILTISTKERCLVEGITISWIAYTR